MPHLILHCRHPLLQRWVGYFLVGELLMHWQHCRPQGSVHLLTPLEESLSHFGLVWMVVAVLVVDYRFHLAHHWVLCLFAPGCLLFLDAPELQHHAAADCQLHQKVPDYWLHLTVLGCLLYLVDCHWLISHKQHCLVEYLIHKRRKRYSYSKSSLIGSF